jgi:hypothetical protein
MDKFASFDADRGGCIDRAEFPLLWQALSTSAGKLRSATSQPASATLIDRITIFFVMYIDCLCCLEMLRLRTVEPRTEK